MTFERKSGKDVTRLLVVEDSPTQAELLRQNLARHGYAISVASNGREALETIAACVPAMVISDVIMPEMSGYELCRQLKSDADLRDIPVVLLTSLSDPQDVITSLECGADGFINKPFDMDYLISRIEDIFANQKPRNGGGAEERVEVRWRGKKHVITSNHQQILDLLLSTYEAALRNDSELIRARDELEELSSRLEELVDERTMELQAEIAGRRRGEERLRQQLSRLDLLNRITRAIADRHDLDSIFRVVVQHLEDHLPVDFGSLCHFDSISRTFIVSVVGQKSLPMAVEIGMEPKAVIHTDENSLGPLLHGQTIYEPNSPMHPFSESPILEKFAGARLHSVVAIPLALEEKVLGVLLAARSGAEAFSSGECEFLRQLCEHIALAVNQSQLNEKLQGAYDELRATQQSMMQQERLRAMGQMASGIAHDINNALGPVSLYAESMLETEPNLSERARRYLETIQSASEDIAHTVARMREFYRKPEQQIALYSTNLNQLVKQVLELTRPRWKDIPQERGIVITIAADLQKNLPYLMGIESEIREALTNLVLNAVDAMPDGGVLSIRTRAAGGRIVLEVSDTGVGMNEDTRCRCIEPFYTTKGERGTGLGLAMVYGVVQRHKGEIEIESEHGRGTTMRLLFKLAVAEGAGPRNERNLSVEPAPLRILDIDDDPLMRRSLKEILESEGHTVEVAEDGQRGVEAFLAAKQRGEPFDAVITDLGMPYMDGREVARIIKHESQDTPVLLLTGWGTHIRAEGEMPQNVNRVLSKPPRIRELRAALREVMAGQA